MRERRPLLLSLLAPGLIAVVAGCSGTSPSAVLSSDNDARRAVLPGLEQHVTLTPADLVTGENVVIRSVITNRGSQPIQLESRICGLTLGGDVRLDWPPGIGMCGGFSMSGPIAPGHSRESTEIRRVGSGPGTYTLRVKHAVRPEVWIELRVAVRR